MESIVYATLVVIVTIACEILELNKSGEAKKLRIGTNFSSRRRMICCGQCTLHQRDRECYGWLISKHPTPPLHAYRQAVKFLRIGANLLVKRIKSKSSLTQSLVMDTSTQ